MDPLKDTWLVSLVSRSRIKLPAISECPVCDSAHFSPKRSRRRRRKKLRKKINKVERIFAIISIRWWIWRRLEGKAIRHGLRFDLIDSDSRGLSYEFRFGLILWLEPIRPALLYTSRWRDTANLERMSRKTREELTLMDDGERELRIEMYR